MENIRFLSENFQLLVAKFSIYLNRRVFVMYDKTSKLTFAPSEDSDQHGLPSSLISLRCPHEVSLGRYQPIERTAKTPIRLGE